MKYDFLIVGAGLFGAVFAYEAKKRGKSVLVIDKRMFINTERIFSTPQIKRYGII